MTKTMIMATAMHCNGLDLPRTSKYCQVVNARQPALFKFSKSYANCPPSLFGSRPSSTEPIFSYAALFGHQHLLHWHCSTISLKGGVATLSSSGVTSDLR